MMRVGVDLAASQHQQLLHFRFACRTLGKLMERWVCGYLERPRLEVASGLSFFDRIIGGASKLRRIARYEPFSD